MRRRLICEIIVLSHNRRKAVSFEGVEQRAKKWGACHFFTRINLFTILLSFDFPNLHYPNHTSHIDTHTHTHSAAHILPNIRAAYIRNGILLCTLYRIHFEMANTIICYYCDGLFLFSYCHCRCHCCGFFISSVN